MKVLFFILILSLNLFAQEKLSTNQWKSLVIDETTESQIIEKFGKPTENKKAKIFIQVSNQKEFDSRLSKKGFRVLKYNQIEQAKNVSFVLNDKNVLILIEYKPIKDIPVQAFLNAYNPIEFRSTVETILGRKQNYYYLRAENEKAIIAVGADMGFFGNVVTGIETNTEVQSNKNLNGDIKIIQLISKTLLNNQNIEVLK